MKTSFTRRLTWVLVLLLLGYGLAVAALGRHLAREHEVESLQRISHGLARHIVERWPELTRGGADTSAASEASDLAARGALLKMLMVVNPGVEVYLLDADGRVAAYIGEPGMVRQHAVDLVPVRAFLSGAPLPLRGTDPMREGSGASKTFSAAMFPPTAGQAKPPGYLYVVLEGQARAQVSGPLGLQGAWQTAAAAAALALLLTLLLGALLFQRLTRPLRELAGRMQRFSVGPVAPTLSALGSRVDAHVDARADALADARADSRAGDEVTAIADSFAAMSTRIASEVQSQADQARAHREVMANVAHDLRTPLTALHGHLEALRLPAATATATAMTSATTTTAFEADAAHRRRLIDTALAQSDKVRRLSQQLFELATLQATDHVLQHERFRLDELVADTVQKFELSAPVALAGPAPGGIELDGDLHLIERALTNLIDNAVRHAGSAQPVQVHVRMHSDGRSAEVLIEDHGPGMPAELARRLDAGTPVRDAPRQRARGGSVGSGNGNGNGGGHGGGMGGLGLAIAQRIAALHGGSLTTLPAPEGGTRLRLALPLRVVVGVA